MILIIGKQEQSNQKTPNGKFFLPKKKSKLIAADNDKKFVKETFTDFQSSFDIKGEWRYISNEQFLLRKLKQPLAIY